jgi:hypothetical protein
MDTPDVVTYRAVRHPQGAGRPFLLARSVIRPLGLFTLPVMVAALVAVLQQRPVLPYVYYAFPAAVVMAVIWTHFEVRFRIVEVHIRAGFVALRSQWEAADPPAAVDWEPLFEVRRAQTYLTVAAGSQAVEFHLDDWPEGDAMAGDLRAALHEGYASY